MCSYIKLIPGVTWQQWHTWAYSILIIHLGRLSKPLPYTTIMSMIHGSHTHKLAHEQNNINKHITHVRGRGMHVYHCFLSSREREGKQGYICMFMVRWEADGLLEIFNLIYPNSKLLSNSHFTHLSVYTVDIPTFSNYLYTTQTIPVPS